jgi:hypothetical protein
MARKAALATVLFGVSSGLVLLAAGCAAPAATASHATGAPTSPAAATITSTPPTPRATVLPTPTPTPSPSPTSIPTPTAVPVADEQSPHFATPDDAMRYLVAAYNKDDVRAEMHVTTPDSRDALEAERQWVKSFSFRDCTQNPGGGDYSCVFDMVELVNTPSPAASAPPIDGFGNAVGAMNEITVLVAPAQRPGWYMYFNEGCGESSAPGEPGASSVAGASSVPGATMSSRSPGS